MPATITDKVIDLAKEYGASPSATANTITEALDLLNDTISGSDQARGSTISDMLSTLSGNIVPSGTITITENGTGIDVSPYATADVNVSGGASVGELVNIGAYSGDMASEPSVGDYFGSASDIFHKVSLSGSDIITNGDPFNSTNIDAVAAMSTITSIWGPAYHSSVDDEIYGYVVTLADGEYGGKVIETISPYQGSFTTEWAVVNTSTGVVQPSTADDPNAMKRYVFDVPSLGEGEALLLKYSFYWD